MMESPHNYPIPLTKYKVMLITHDREKLIQTMIYFAQNTKHCGKTKLFKLLYFLDFEHFKDTGRSVTGLTYSAWKMGPVPTELFDELESPDPDMARALEVSKIETYRGNPMLSLKPLTEFDDSHFSKREMKLLKSLAEEYESSNAEDMIEETHLENLPWDRVYRQENRKQAEIPYSYALREEEREQMMQLVEDRKELIEAFQ